MVPAGAASVSFTVTTRLVAADTNATISALLGADKRDVVLRVMAPIPRPPTLRRWRLNRPSLKGGQNTRGTIRLTGPALAHDGRRSPEQQHARNLPPCDLNTMPLRHGAAGASSATFTSQPVP